jgi:hypothetical protein
VKQYPARTCAYRSGSVALNPKLRVVVCQRHTAGGWSWRYLDGSKSGTIIVFRVSAPRSTKLGTLRSVPGCAVAAPSPQSRNADGPRFCATRSKSQLSPSLNVGWTCRKAEPNSAASSPKPSAGAAGKRGWQTILLPPRSSWDILQPSNRRSSRKPGKTGRSPNCRRPTSERPGSLLTSPSCTCGWLKALAKESPSAQTLMWPCNATSCWT